MRVWTNGFWNRAVSTAGLLSVAGAVLVAASLGGIAATRHGAEGNPAAGTARALSQGFREATKAVQPAVVMIKSEATMPVQLGGGSPGDEGPSIERWFGDPQRGMPDMRKFFKDAPRMPKQGQGGIGSGLIIDPAGVILTNRHVVADGRKITVRLHDGREYVATKAVTDPKTDLAVLRIEGADGLTAARLGNSDEVEVGDWVLALGHPFGLEGTVTAGIVSAKGRGIGMAEREEYLQTDAAINPGNSGGPLVNLDGEVIGINTAISSSSGGNEGVGFAIPVNLAKWVAKQLSDGGTVHRARLGVMIQPLTHELAQQFGLKPREGVLVGDVTPDSPAAKTGLKSGDVIVEFGGKSVTTPQDLQSHVEQAPIGKEQSVVVLREGKRVELKATMTEMPGDKTVASGGMDVGQSSQLGRVGMEVQALNPDLARKLEIRAEHGVAITEVKPGSLAERAGLASGMVILEAGRKPAKTAEELTKAIDEKALAKGVLLLVRTAEGSRFVVLRG
jgi:serine protease Do